MQSIIIILTQTVEVQLQQIAGTRPLMGSIKNS